MSAWHAVVVSICAHGNGHWSLAVGTQFWSSACDAEAELPVVSLQAATQLATKPRAERGASTLTTRTTRCLG
jgi:hypothetical protein